MFVGLTLLIYSFGYGRIKRNYHVINYLLIFLFLWIGIPTFGECVLWLTGSINYMWMMNIVLLFILPYRMSLNENEKIIKDSIINYLIFFILGIVAGWTNENTAFSAILFVCLIVGYKFYKKQIVHKWCYYGLIGALIGFIIMIIAPGNFNRASSFNFSIIQRVFYFIESVESNLGSMGFIFFILIIFGLGYTILGKKNDIENIILNIFLFISALTCIITMSLSAYFPLRSLFGFSIYMVILSITLLENVKINCNYDILYKIGWTSILGCLFILTFSRTVYSLERINNELDKRENLIQHEINQGSKEVILEPIYKSTLKYVFFIELSTDYNDWKNRSYSKYWGIPIRIEEMKN